MSTSVKENKITPITSDQYEADSDRWLDMFSLFIHDLESPLVTIKYLLKIIEDGNFSYDNNHHKQITKSSMIALQRSESILYDLMAVAKSGKMEIPVSMTTLDPVKVIQESMDLSIGAAAENNISISFEDNSKGASVQADSKLLKRMIDNLLYNAIRHTPAGKDVNVTTKKENRSLYIHIKDSGVGLGDIDPTKLFEKYGQIELRADKKHRGVGLGLYFCRLAASGMNGTILADDHPDGGAVFSIKLLLAEGK